MPQNVNLTCTLLSLVDSAEAVSAVFTQSGDAETCLVVRHETDF
jgi:hypothetical protein